MIPLGSDPLLFEAHAAAIPAIVSRSTSTITTEARAFRASPPAVSPPRLVPGPTAVVVGGGGGGGGGMAGLSLGDNPNGVGRLPCPKIPRRVSQRIAPFACALAPGPVPAPVHEPVADDIAPAPIAGVDAAAAADTAACRTTYPWAFLAGHGNVPPVCHAVHETSFVETTSLVYQAQRVRLVPACTISPAGIASYTAAVLPGEPSAVPPVAFGGDVLSPVPGAYGRGVATLVDDSGTLGAVVAVVLQRVAARRAHLAASFETCATTVRGFGSGALAALPGFSAGGVPVVSAPRPDRAGAAAAIAFDVGGRAMVSIEGPSLWEAIGAVRDLAGLALTPPETGNVDAAAAAAAAVNVARRELVSLRAVPDSVVLAILPPSDLGPPCPVGRVLGGADGGGSAAPFIAELVRAVFDDALAT